MTSGRLVLCGVVLGTAVSQAFGRFTYSLLFTDVRDDLGISNTAAGAMGSANLVAYLVGSLGVSLIVGRWGLGAVARAGLAGVTCGLGLLAWGPSTAVIAAALVLTGCAAAGVWVTTPAIATEILGVARRGIALGLVGTGVGIGVITASLLDLAVGGTDFRSVYVVEFAVGLVVLISLMSSMPRRGGTTGDRMSGFAALRMVPNWRRLLIEYLLLAWAMSTVMTFTVGFLEDDAHVGRTTANAAFLMIGVGIVLGGPVFGPLTDKFGPLRSQVAGLALMASSTLVIATGHPAAALCAASGFGMAFTGGPVTIGARIGDHLDGEAFGAAYGIATIAFGLGLAIGPQLGGILADASGSSRPALLVTALVSLTALVVTLSEGGLLSERVEDPR